MADNLSPVDFALEDVFRGKPLSPDNVDLPTLRGFLAEVETLIKGDSVNLNLADTRVELQTGSLKVVTLVAAAVASNLQFEMGKLAKSGDLDQIQSNRAKIILKWQSRAEKSPTRKYAILPTDPVRVVRIASQSHYQHHSKNAWVTVEKYLTGTVEDYGGKQDPNIHLSLPDSGQTLRVFATKDQLREQKENQLYKNVTLFVRADQHMLTKQLDNLVLLHFATSGSSVDEDLLQTLWREGREAWKDVPSATRWVEELRGNE